MEFPEKDAFDDGQYSEYLRSCGRFRELGYIFFSLAAERVFVERVDGLLLKVLM